MGKETLFVSVLVLYVLLIIVMSITGQSLLSGDINELKGKEGTTTTQLNSVDVIFKIMTFQVKSEIVWISVLMYLPPIFLLYVFLSMVRGD